MLRVAESPTTEFGVNSSTGRPLLLIPELATGFPQGNTMSLRNTSTCLSSPSQAQQQSTNSLFAGLLPAFGRGDLDLGGSPTLTNVIELRLISQLVIALQAQQFVDMGQNGNFMCACDTLTSPQRLETLFFQAVHNFARVPPSCTSFVPSSSGSSMKSFRFRSPQRKAFVKMEWAGVPRPCLGPVVWTDHRLLPP